MKRIGNPVDHRHRILGFLALPVGNEFAVGSKIDEPVAFFLGQLRWSPEKNARVLAPLDQFENRGVCDMPCTNIDSEIKIRLVAFDWRQRLIVGKHSSEIAHAHSPRDLPSLPNHIQVLVP
ncbi:MAG: hypothetical protein A4E62_01984 [Syntrophorhabdus sp. PtaU1.Bin002]|nr:MAG: hypothetical protein A4E62_01984 [Syntrophorhabdus sp. PtaU1.Bin002]